MALFLLKTKLIILALATFLSLSCANPNHCFYNSDCDKEQSCLSAKCTAWQCRDNNDCDKGIRVCDRPVIRVKNAHLIGIVAMGCIA